jgi:seryl-tRNA synthetase
MIDLHRLRTDPRVLELLKKKDPSFDTVRLIELDAQFRKAKIEVDALRARKNELAKQGQGGITPELRERSKVLSDELKQKELHLEAVKKDFEELYLWCPNIIMESVPDGGKEQNLVVKEWGEKPSFTFEPKHHVELGERNGWFNFEAAVRMAGSNFALYTNDAVIVIYKLLMFMFNANLAHGFKPVLPPFLVNEKALEGSGNFPRFKEEVYAIPDDRLYLTPTSEVNLTSMYRDHILSAKELPIRMTALTSCFRREAGTYGAAERGLIRIHQFEKLELYTLCEPEHSQLEQDRMVACAESILQALGLHYRVSLLAAQDCSFSSAKTYDIEVWFPQQGVYKEVSSASNCTDFQARRSEIRYKKHENEKPTLVYTLNASSLALPRLLVALMETYQQADGSIVLPAILNSVTVK